MPFGPVPCTTATASSKRLYCDAYSVHSVTAQRNDDGSVTVCFGDFGDGRPNCVPITDGWNHVVRLYRPLREVVDGAWTFLEPEPV